MSVPARPPEMRYESYDWEYTDPTRSFAKITLTGVNPSLLSTLLEVIGKAKPHERFEVYPYELGWELVDHMNVRRVALFNYIDEAQVSALALNTRHRTASSQP